MPSIILLLCQLLQPLVDAHRWIKVAILVAIWRSEVVAQDEPASNGQIGLGHSVAIRALFYQSDQFLFLVYLRANITLRIRWCVRVAPAGHSVLNAVKPTLRCGLLALSSATSDH